MSKNLVIVESPAKAKTIEKFLGKDYKVMSSYGHIRDLKKRNISIDMQNLEPEYEVPTEKRKMVDDLKEQAEKAESVWLASDEDREGEAISWHLCEVLGLDEDKTNRIVFHEITKNAILEAIAHPRRLDMNLVNAQQARRVLDRLVGFKLSPVLWKKVKPSLSAGRVQSVAVRLIVEREREIEAFAHERYYRLNAVFKANDNGKEVEMKAELDTRFKMRAEAQDFLLRHEYADHTVENLVKKPLTKMPAPPFTTSTLQQEAARKLGLTVSQTMALAQRLYENGFITYMRTDSVNLSNFCKSACQETIKKLYGEKYSSQRDYKTHSKGAQEAHEAIRPTDMANQSIVATAQEKRLYELIWKRTLASQMANAEVEKTTITIKTSASSHLFTVSGETVTFDGFLKVYRESTDDDEVKGKDKSKTLPNLQIGDELLCKEMTSTERTAQPPARYSEASLVHKLEELGIGRPSTYAPTISTIQQRQYVQKGEKKADERSYIVETVKNGKLSYKTKHELVAGDKGKLLPTDVGIVVNDYLVENFPVILDYNFTANVEQEFDSIASGKAKWTAIISDFYKEFEPMVDAAITTHTVHKAGERVLGTDPASGKPVSVKIGRFGPVAQIGSADDEEKPRFAHIPSEKNLSTITLEETLDLFRLPRTIGEYEGQEVTIGTGRFGPYVLYDKKFTSLPKEFDPLTITLEEAMKVIEDKRKQEEQKHIKIFDGEDKIEILNGRYGPYIVYGGKNYRMPKNLHEKAAELTYEECMKIVNSAKKSDGR